LINVQQKIEAAYRIHSNADLVVNASVGSLYAMAEQVIAGKTTIQMKNVRVIDNVQVRRLPAGLKKASEMYVFLDQLDVMV